MSEKYVKWCENCAMLEKMYLDAKANNDDQVKAIREWQAKSAACEKHCAALREENAQLRMENHCGGGGTRCDNADPCWAHARDEARAEVARLRRLISGYYRLPSSEWAEALKVEARAAFAAGEAVTEVDR